MEKIIFDTDIGGDCDDTGSLAIVHECERAGKAKLLAVTLSTASPYACLLYTSPSPRDEQ